MTYDLGLGTTRQFGREVTIVRDADGNPTTLTGPQLEALAAQLSVGRLEGAYQLGISPNTLRHRMERVTKRLLVDRMVQAAVVLGWVSIPPEIKAVVDGTSDALPRATPGREGLAAQAPASAMTSGQQ